jgi:hypothetical protein
MTKLLLKLPGKLGFIYRELVHLATEDAKELTKVSIVGTPAYWFVDENNNFAIWPLPKNNKAEIVVEISYPSRT